VAFPTITEKYGSLSATGLAKEATFGTPVAATTFLPMTGNTMEEDPGWFAPHLMQNLRDLQVYNLYGEAHYTGAIDGPLFPANAMELLVSSIGADNLAGAGVTGAAGTGSTTLSAGVSIGATSITVASASGFTVGQVIQIDVNGTGPTTTAECRAITTIVSTTISFSTALVYAHLSSAAVVGVVAPYTHTIQEQNTLSSLTVEKNIGGYQSLQFAGCKVGKFDLKAPTGNEAVSISANMVGQSVAILTTPTTVSVLTPDIPFVFAEATLSIFGSLRSEVSNTTVSIDNGLKETYTYSGQHGPSFITPVTLHTSGTIDLVFDSLNDSTYGDFTRMANGTTGAYTFTLTHPASAGTITISQPQIVLSKYANDLKMDDVVMSTLTYEASRPLSGASQYTIQATVVNSVFLPY